MEKNGCRSEKLVLQGVVSCVCSVFCIIHPPPPEVFASYKMCKPAGSNPLYPLEVEQHWIISQTVSKRSAYNISVQNLLLVGLILT